MLIAGELDLDVPDISFNDVELFLKETENTHFTIPGLAREENEFFQTNAKKYPWERRILEVKGQQFYDYQSRKPFSDLVTIIDKLPIVAETRVVLLLYQQHQPLYDFTWHFDRDAEFGFRLCFGLETTKPFLEFARMNEEFINYAKEHTEKSVILKKHMVNESKIYGIIPTRSNSIICINGHQYCHRVPVVNAAARVSLIVRGKLTTTNFDLRQGIEDELHS